LLGRNKLWTLIKNYAWPEVLLYLPAILGYDTAAWMAALLQGDPNPLRGRLAALRASGAAWAQRKQIQRGERHVPLSPLKNPIRMWRTQRSLRRQLRARSA
jgi:hypothetical protein